MDSKKILAMREGGKKLGQIKRQLRDFTVPGVTFASIEEQAQLLIKEAGALPSFSTVQNYNWATCITKNEGVCHGIPSPDIVVADGDIITIDVGLIQDGYHLDTSITFAVGQVPKSTTEFLEIGQRSLQKAIAKAKPGNSVYDISKAMEKVVQRAGYDAVYQLTGHGIGKELHQDPAIPCIPQKSDKRYKLEAGQTLAIEIMYAMDDAELVLDDDGWTYRTKDMSLTGMFEETVLVTDKEPEILTR